MTAMQQVTQLTKEVDALQNELQVCKRRLESKIDALLILSKELDQCRTERDQFKLMAEQLRERYQNLKWQVSGKSPVPDCPDDLPVAKQPLAEENLALALYRAKEANKCLHFEVDDLKQKLQDAEGDVKLLREQIARQRVGTADEGMNTRYFPAAERETLVKQLEASQEQCVQLERDLQQVIDEKEEQETERDAFKHKYERLNKELNYILKGDENKILDIDGLVNENSYLSERLKQMEEEKMQAMATLSKYKSLLEKKKSQKGILKIGAQRNAGVVLSQKQVHHLLENQSSLAASPQTLADLQALSKALLDSLNDKSLALSHQRKTNKILGQRVAELEKKLKTLEVGGLWNMPAGQYATLEKLKSECSDIKSLIPSDQQSSSGKSGDDVTEAHCDVTEAGDKCGPLSPGAAGALLADLDLLPTRENETVGDLHSLDCLEDDDDDDDTDDEHAETTDLGDENSENAENATINTDTYINPDQEMENELQSLLQDGISGLTGKDCSSKRRQKMAPESPATPDSPMIPDSPERFQIPDSPERSQGEVDTATLLQL